jgi:hypothetical protein
VRRTGWLPLALWPVGAAAVVTGFVLLLGGDEDVTAGALVLRSVGASFIACGLIAWQRRPDTGTGPLMTLTGFVFLAGQLLAEVDRPLGHTLADIVATWWYVPFATLVLGFPSGRLASRIDRLLVAGFVLGGVVLQLLWVAADGEVADRIDQLQRALNSSLAIAVAAAAADRWIRAAPPLRRLLLPTLAGAFALSVLGAQGF